MFTAHLTQHPPATSYIERPAEEQAPHSRLPCALQRPSLLPRPCPGDAEVPAERDCLTSMGDASATRSSFQKGTPGGQTALFKNWLMLLSLSANTWHFWQCF